MASLLARRILKVSNVRLVNKAVSRNYAEAAGTNLALTFSTPTEVKFDCFVLLDPRLTGFYGFEILAS